MLAFTRSNTAQHGTYRIDHAGPCQEFDGYLPGEYSVKYGDVISGKKPKCKLLMLMTKELVEYCLTPCHGNMDTQGVIDELKPFKLAHTRTEFFWSVFYHSRGRIGLEGNTIKWTDALQRACPSLDWRQYNTRRARERSKK